LLGTGKSEELELLVSTEFQVGRLKQENLKFEFSEEKKEFLEMDGGVHNTDELHTL
jgi:hypothetical protein